MSTVKQKTLKYGKKGQGTAYFLNGGGDCKDIRCVVIEKRGTENGRERFAPGYPEL